MKLSTRVNIHGQIPINCHKLAHTRKFSFLLIFLCLSLIMLSVISIILTRSAWALKCLPQIAFKDGLRKLWFAFDSSPHWVCQKSKVLNQNIVQKLSLEILLFNQVVKPKRIWKKGRKEESYKAVYILDIAFGNKYSNFVCDFQQESTAFQWNIFAAIVCHWVPPKQY